MKKIFVFGVLAAVLMLGLGAAGIAYAQDQTPVVPEDGYVPGMMGARGGNGMMGSRGNMGDRGVARLDRTPVSDQMQVLMEAAIADVFGFTPVEIQAAHNNGTTLYDLALAKGLTQDEFAEKMTQARAQALEQAVAQGLISQEQADWMLSRMGAMGSYGAGSCMGSAQGTQGGRGRWNNQPVQPAAPDA